MLRSLPSRFCKSPPRGVRHGRKTATWAETGFPAELQPIGAYVAEVLIDQAGVTLPEIEPSSRFAEDLRIDEETVEIVMTLEEDLAISIPVENLCQLTTVSDLVDYLHRRLYPGRPDRNRKKAPHVFTLRRSRPGRSSISYPP